MKTQLSLLLLTLACFLYRISAAPVAPSLPHDCCPGFNRTHVPRRYVRHVAMTQSDCRLTAMVVTTVCDRRICIDGNWTWAEKLLDEFKKSTSNNKPPSAPFNVAQCLKKPNRP